MSNTTGKKLWIFTGAVLLASSVILYFNYKKPERRENSPEPLEFLVGNDLVEFFTETDDETKELSNEVEDELSEDDQDKTLFRQYLKIVQLP